MPPARSSRCSAIPTCISCLGSVGQDEQHALSLCRTAGCIPSVSRYQAFPLSDPYRAIGVVASNVATAYCRFYGEKFLWPNFLVDNLKSLPFAQLDKPLEDALRNAVSSGVDQRRAHFAQREPFREFIGPALLT